MMDNFGYERGVMAYGPAANIERTMYGTTVVRVAEDRPSRPQMMMPFLNPSPYAAHNNNNAFKFHTVRATRLGTPVAITIEPPPMYSQAHTGFQIEHAQSAENWVPLQAPQVMQCVPQPAPVVINSVGRHQGQQYLLPPAHQQITEISQPTLRPTPGRMTSYEGKSPIETYAPRSFASNDGDEAHPLSKKQNYNKKKREKKQREKVIVISKVEKEARPERKEKKRMSGRRKRRDSTSTESSSSSSSSESSDSSSSSDSEDEEQPKQKDKKKMKKGPRVYNYLEYAIVSFIFNMLFGTVAIVLAVSSKNSERQRKFKQAKWEGVFAGVTATLGILISAVIVVIILLYLYTDAVCKDCA